MGEIQRSGLHFIPTDTTLVKAISMAGGPTGSAQLKEVLLSRASTDGSVKQYEFDLSNGGDTDSQNFKVQSGDTIFIKRDHFMENRSYYTSLVSIALSIITTFFIVTKFRRKCECSSAIKILPAYFGGIELVAKMFTKAHADLGDNVFIVAFRNSEKHQTVGEYGEKIEWIESSLQFKSAPVNWSFIFKFRQYVQINKIQKIYVHLPNPYMHEVVRLHKDFLKKNNIQVIAIYHSDIINQKFLSIFYDRYFLYTCDAYDNIIVSSENLWRSSGVLSHIPPEKKKIIPFCSEGLMQFTPRSEFKVSFWPLAGWCHIKGLSF